MIECAQRYNVLVDYFNPNDTLKCPHFSNLEYQEALAKTLEDTFSRLVQSVPEECEIVSHSVTHSLDTYILTVFLKNKTAPAAASG